VVLKKNGCVVWQNNGSNATESVQSDLPVHGHTLPVISAIGQWPHHDALLQSSPRLNKPLLKNYFFDIPQVHELQYVGEVGKLTTF